MLTSPERDRQVVHELKPLFALLLVVVCGSEAGRQTVHVMQLGLQRCDAELCRCRCAGIVRGADFLDMTETDFDEVIAVNLKGVFLASSLPFSLALMHTACYACSIQQNLFHCP